MIVFEDSSHVGAEFIIVSTPRRYVFRYSWRPAGEAQRHLFVAEYRRGPVPVPVFGLTLAFDHIYAGTNVPAILHPIRDDEEDAEVTLDSRDFAR
jgi:hypothetical protein